MKLISWNVNARVKDTLKQIKALRSYEPHVVALQDIRKTSLFHYERAFAEMGLKHVLHTFQGSTAETTPTGVLIASCFELERLPSPPCFVLWPKGYWSPNPEKVMRHWTRRMLFATCHSPWGKI